MKKIIFDMDGVIVDSEYTYLEGKTQVLKEAGIDKPISYQYQFMGTSYEHMWTVMKEDLGLEKDIDYYIKEQERIRHEMIEKNGVLAIKNVIELVKELYEKGYRMALASSSPKSEIVKNLKELDILDYFEHLVSGEELERSKPAPDIFLKAAELLGAEPEDCVVIEDTKNGVLAAKNAGMYCIGFSNPQYQVQDLSMADEIVKDMGDIEIED